MRGLGSRIPTVGQSTSQSKTPSTTSIKKPNPVTSKLTRPTDIGPFLGFARPSVVSQKFSQCRSSIANFSSKILPRSFSTEKLPPKEAASQDVMKQPLQITSVNIPPRHNPDDDQMLIDETIDLVGSEENVNRLGGATLSKENLAFNPTNATFDLCRRDGTFIKSPTIQFNATKTIGSVNSLLDTKESTQAANLPGASHRAVSKSRDSLNVLGNQTRIIRLRKSGDLMGSNMSLPKSPEWGSEDMLNMTNNKSGVFNSTMMNNRLIDATPYRPGLNFTMKNNSMVNTTALLCLTPDESKTLMHETAMEVDEDGAVGGVVMRETSREEIDAQKRHSFGMDITDCTLDCSIELIDASISSAVNPDKFSPIGKQGSFDVDESLGILTPDQMKEFLDSTATNHTNNLELPLIPGHKLSHQCRMDQTPSPEELPLDPVGVKTDLTDEIMHGGQSQAPMPSTSSQQEVSQTESDPKTEMTKSANSKVSNSIITSITSITSLDTGYIGDGELSRPASRGADQSPSKVPLNIQLNPLNWNPAPPAPVHRRIDPMTDSDFFTESDADDVYHQRENQRRAQVIDGQLYGPMQQGENVFIQQPQGETDSCMESSGVFTDVENRGDDYLLNRLAENQNAANPNDMSPDLSSDTISSSHTACSQKKFNTASSSPTQHVSERHDFINETSSTCSAMDEGGETINLISDASFGSTKTQSSVVSDGRSEENASASSSAITKKATSVKKTSGTSRKSHKNEANLGLKKHEMTSRGVVKSRLGLKDNHENKLSTGVPKKNLNGKWDPIVNKIAENKSVKKKFDNVKSKVTCGVVKRNSPTKTPLGDDVSVVSVESTGAVAKKSQGGPSGSKR